MQDEIVALDAQTLQPRHRFGLSLLDGACGMVVVGEELFVCDTGNDRLQVFSLAGEHRRSITGEWKRPQALCFVKDRLYLVEAADNEEYEDDELINPLCGRRIFVLSLQGDTLQVYTHPVEGQIFRTEDVPVLCCFDGKLLAPVLDEDSAEVVGVGVDPTDERPPIASFPGGDGLADEAAEVGVGYASPVVPRHSVLGVAHVV